MWQRGLFGFIIAAVIIGIVGWLRWDRDLWQIKRRSEQLAQTLHKEPGEGLLTLAQRAGKITDFFAQSPNIIAGDPLPAIASREELISIASASLQAAKRLTTRMLERDVQWLHPHTAAVMYVTLEVAAEGLGERQTQQHCYELKWTHEDGQWVIASVHPSENLHRPARSGH